MMRLLTWPLTAVVPRFNPGVIYGRLSGGGGREDAGAGRGWISDADGRSPQRVRAAERPRSFTLDLEPRLDVSSRPEALQEELLP